MRHFFIFGIIILVLISVFNPTSLIADEKEQDQRNLPKSGILSGSFRTSGSGMNVQDGWGREDTDMFSEDKSPITGSVSRVNARDWAIRVYNNSEDKYSLSVRVTEFDKNKKPINTMTRSYTMDGKSNRSENFTARFNTEQAQLELVSWRNLTPPKKQQKQGDDSAEVIIDD
jgi:hypothetical protein